MSNINFREEMAKIGIEICEDMIEQSKEDTLLLLKEEYDSQYVEWEKDFRQWCRKEKSKDRQKLLDIRD